MYASAHSPMSNNKSAMINMEALHIVEGAISATRRCLNKTVLSSIIKKTCTTNPKASQAS